MNAEIIGYLHAYASTKPYSDYTHIYSAGQRTLYISPLRIESHSFTVINILANEENAVHMMHAADAIHTLVVTPGSLPIFDW